MDKLSSRIKNKLNDIPSLPGIYKMIDSEGRIIYVGKSICLRNRVRSYFSASNKWSKVEKMVGLISDIEYKVTDTHLEARLEECKLIKELKPMFNSQMKNDKNYVYLKVEDNKINKPLSVVYSREENSFGPFRGKFTLLELTKSLENLYPIIKTNGSYDFSYKFIPIDMDNDSYDSNKNCLMDIFSDDKNLLKFIDVLDKKMKEAASNLQFETATNYRNLIYSLNFIYSGLNAYKNIYFKNILLKLDTPKGYKLFYINKGEVLYKKNYNKLSDKDINGFIKKGKSLVKSDKKAYNEKSSMDFRNILYSEIQALPKDKVIYLDE